MPRLTVNRENQVTDIPFEGIPVLSFVLRQNRLLHETPCGGKGVCGKCKIQAAGELSPPTAKEREWLTPKELQGGIRLSCQARLLGNASVSIQKAAELINISVEGELPPFSNHPMLGRFGVAVDIGTTTLALRLVDLEQCRILAAVSAANPQGSIAADVIGRIEAAMAGEGGLLHALLVLEIEGLLESLCKKCMVSVEDVELLILAGNTTMLYLLSGRSPEKLSHAPFEADCLYGYWTDGGSLGINKAAHAGVYLPACISAFVGADITCGVLASQMYKRKETALLVDLGTNGEIALWHQGKLYCCATAAGPAFEGGGIRMGVGSVAGAIDRVWMADGKLSCTTIGGEKPVGICGSGIINAVAGLLQLGLIDEAGFMEKGEVFINGEISLSQKDIRSVQLAKGAIAAGIRTICHHVGISPSQIETLFIAGGFGSHVDIGNAANIGLIPEELAGKAVVLGNASLTGVVMLLLQQDFESDSIEIARHAVSVPLGGCSIFAEHYMACMMFERNTMEDGYGNEL